jgi:hypothetical protein
LSNDGMSKNTDMVDFIWPHPNSPRRCFVPTSGVKVCLHHQLNLAVLCHTTPSYQS